MDRAERREFVRKHRVVIRVRPYPSFATPPRHVYRPDGVGTLTRFTSTSMPW